MTATHFTRVAKGVHLKFVKVLKLVRFAVCVKFVSRVSKDHAALNVLGPPRTPTPITEW